MWTGLSALMIALTLYIPARSGSAAGRAAPLRLTKAAKSTKLMCATKMGKRCGGYVACCLGLLFQGILMPQRYLNAPTLASLACAICIECHIGIVHF